MCWVSFAYLFQSSDDKSGLPRTRRDWRIPIIDHTNMGDCLSIFPFPVTIHCEWRSPSDAHYSNWNNHNEFFNFRCFWLFHSLSEDIPSETAGHVMPVTQFSSRSRHPCWLSSLLFAFPRRLPFSPQSDISRDGLSVLSVINCFWIIEPVRKSAILCECLAESLHWHFSSRDAIGAHASTFYIWHSPFSIFHSPFFSILSRAKFS